MGQLNIPAASIVYVDTAIVIYSIEKFPDYFPLLETMWKQLQSSQIQVITSELTLLETLVMPLRNGNTDLIARYEAMLLSSEISLIPINQAILKQAASIRATTNLKTPDGSIIHIRPSGEIVRTGPKILAPNGKYYRRRYDQFGNQIQFVPGANTHSTGEQLSL